MSIPYSAVIDMNADTRQFIKDQQYTLYLFKGINAGPGAVSTVWTTISNDQLYDQEQNTVGWSEDYYIGEESNEVKNGASVAGVNPYISKSSVQSVNLGKNYTFPGVKWNSQATDAPDTTLFSIHNKELRVNNFYVSQKVLTGPGDYIVVKSILGDGLGTFEPIETIAMMLAARPVSTGTMITQAFSAGALVTLAGITEASISYDKDKSWTVSAGDYKKLEIGDNVYNSMLKAASVSAATQMARAQARWQRLGGGGGLPDKINSVSWNNSAFATEETGDNHFEGTITVNTALAAGFVLFVIASVKFNIKRYTSNTILDFSYDGPLTFDTVKGYLYNGVMALFS